MNTVSFINPITKQPVEIFVHQVFGVTYLPTNACTVVTSVGGAAIPVDVSIEEAVSKIKQALMADNGLANKGITDGI